MKGDHLVMFYHLNFSQLQQSRELDQQLSVSQQRLHILQRELEEMQHCCEALTKELEANKLQLEEKVKKKIII